jgi:small subunit ribosomal protein S4
MSRYRGPRLRITRRLGELPGLTRKASARQNPPGQHGALPKKPSQYSIRLQEKQKLRFNYGISEHQLIGLVKKARRQVGSTGERILQLLEMRLDTIIYRSGFAPTLRASRQLVSHGHVQVNARAVNIPSYQMKVGDIFGIRGQERSYAKANSSQNGEAKLAPVGIPQPKHLDFNNSGASSGGTGLALQGVVKQIIDRQDVGCTVDEFLIIEYYSRKI